MQSKAATVEAYLKELPEDRRAAIAAVRGVILKNMDQGFEEGMSYGMIGYCVPHSIFPPGYHCNPAQPLPFAGLASQKQYMSLYMMSAYGDTGEDAWLREQFKKAGKKLDMGKCCIRFKKLDDLPLDVIAQAFRRVTLKDYVARYERALEAMGKGKNSKEARRKKPTPARPAKKAGAGRATPPAAKPVRKAARKTTKR
jgi:hypothetical protein